MSKRLIIALTTIAMTLGTSTLSNAQIKPAAGGQTQSPGGRGQKLKDALAQLDLTAKQKSEIKGIMEDMRSKMQALKNGGGKTADKSQAREIMKATVQKILGVLDNGQKAKLKKILEADKTSRTTKPTA